MLRTIAVLAVLVVGPQLPADAQSERAADSPAFEKSAISVARELRKAERGRTETRVLVWPCRQPAEAANEYSNLFARHFARTLLNSLAKAGPFAGQIRIDNGLVDAVGPAVALQSESVALDDAASRQYHFLVTGICKPESRHVQVDLDLWNVMLRKKLRRTKARLPRNIEIDAALNQPLGTAPSSKSLEGKEAWLGVGRDGTTVPQCIYCPNPNYDPRSLDKTGSVVVRVLVTADGRPENIVVIRRLDQHLDERAVEAVRKWKFKPATRDGKPVAVWTTIEITFRLVP